MERSKIRLAATAYPDKDRCLKQANEGYSIRIVGWMTQPGTVMRQNGVKSSDQTFSDTLFVSTTFRAARKRAPENVYLRASRHQAFLREAHGERLEPAEFPPTRVGPSLVF